MFRVFALAVLALLAPLEGGGVMLAARQIFLGRSAKAAAPTAKSYVQDGLVAMWDGIENAGWGQHDATATTWKDLIGSQNFTLAQSAAFEDDCVLGTASGNTITATINSWDWLSGTIWAGKTLTMEFVQRSLFARNNDNFPLTGGYGGIFFYNDSNNYGVNVLRGNRYVWGNTGWIRPALGTGKASFSVASSDGAPVRYYRDGGSQQTFGNPNYGFVVRPQLITRYPYMSFSGRLYAMRLYSRALTADEIAANYAIDKARFNLP